MMDLDRQLARIVAVAVMVAERSAEVAQADLAALATYYKRSIAQRARRVME